LLATAFGNGTPLSFYTIDIAPTMIATLARRNELDANSPLDKIKEIADVIIDRIGSDVDEKRITGEYLTKLSGI